jgi:hypothetical protein
VADRRERPSGLFFDVRNPMKVSDDLLLRVRATGAGRDTGIAKLRLWIDSYGAGSCRGFGFGMAPRNLASVRLGRSGASLRSPVNRSRDSDRFGLLDRAFVLRDGRRARGEASTAFGRGRRFPTGSFFGTDRCLVPGDDSASSGMLSMRHPWFLREEGSGHPAGNRVGAERSSSQVRRGFLRIFASVRRIDFGRGCLEVERKDLEGEQSPWKDRMRPDRQRSGSASGLDGGATPRSRRSGSRSSEAARWQRRGVEGPRVPVANGKGATAAVTRCGCRRGFLRGV